MKKAILIICVLSVLALLVVPVVAGVLTADGDLDRQIAPGSFMSPRGQAEVESPTQTICGYWRGPAPQN